MNILLRIIILFSAGSIFSQQESGLLKSQYETDLNFLIEKLEEVHPNPYVSYSKDRFLMEVEEIQWRIDNNNLSKNDFAKLIMPLIANLNDGHTEVKAPRSDYQSFMAQEKNSFPFQVIVENSLVRIKEGKYDEYTLISINEVPVETFIPRVRSYISAETESFRNAVLSRTFHKYIWFELGSVESIQLKSKENKVITVSSSEFTEGYIKNSQSTPDYDYQSIGNIDWLEIVDMAGSKNFKRTLDQLDTSSEGDTLIIDLRNCGGGRSAIGDILIKSLYDKSYHQVKELKLKSSKTQKQYISKTYLPFYAYPFLPFAATQPVVRATFFGKHGKTHTFNLKQKSAGKKKLNYDQVYVLVSNYTFSSAAILANALDHYGIGTLVGEEAGGVKHFFGDNIVVTLPNSDLRCTISFKEFLLPGASDDLPEANIIEPEIPLNAIQLMSPERVIELISN